MTNAVRLITIGFLLSALMPSPAQSQPTRFNSLNYLYSISGKTTATGQHNREPSAQPAKWTNRIDSLTGHYPKLWSGDFLFQADNIANRGVMIAEAKRQWKKGALINLMWHACNPARSQPCGWDSTGVLSRMTDQQWQQLLTDGTPINTRWKQMMDEVAVYLQDLEDSGVEVFFRPLHEMNQGLFWWGGRRGASGTAQLYRLTHDYFTKTKGLSNLIWVWDMQDFLSLATDLTDYNPGNDYWDVAALDLYDSGTGYSDYKYNAMLKVAGNKPIAIGECQVLPTPAQLATQPRWTFFMGWAELVFSFNTPTVIKELYNSKEVENLND
ncbi:glycosyl hydrolase [uncultured Spirosoma sp.]|uniref:glycoside hydrolase family 26 protein n=1 Tax=uncultured Spirosoma sp. TaxID=278208 RepID=UPI00258FF27C|nr:glycosyl hydrolase [uncultured Spirosoma sp.]